MLKYEQLSPEITEKIESDRANNTLPQLAFDENKVLRRDNERDKATIIRPPFIRDIDKIMHCPFYNRYADKTQVLSFYKNDDITRRALHVQLVSRIARTIGKALNLNLDLIEAIALGHDIGHTPFGHAGEDFLDQLYFEHTGRHFSHNIHSVRVLDKIFPYNISLQTLNGIAAHDGEMELCEYHPKPLDNFTDFDEQIEACYIDKNNVKKLLAPATLEGCVMRISDIIAYLGKDRQDADRAKIICNKDFEDSTIGIYNAQIINNMIVNIVENSYVKDYIKMDEEHFEALKKAKADNYKLIYKQEAVGEAYKTVKPMMAELYEKLLEDIVNENKASPIFTHHIDYVNQAHYKREISYEETEPNQIVVDYIASMTDDYFVDIYNYLFPNSTKKIDYKGYFG